MSRSESYSRGVQGPKCLATTPPGFNLNKKNYSNVKKDAPAKVASVVPPKSTPVATPTPPAKAAAPTTTKSSIPPPPPKTKSDQSVIQELESLRADISAMRDIIARLYSDSLGYLQEMKEEVRAMLDYIRTKEG